MFPHLMEVIYNNYDFPKDVQTLLFRQFLFFDNILLEIDVKMRVGTVVMRR